MAWLLDVSAPERLGITGSVRISKFKLQKKTGIEISTLNQVGFENSALSRLARCFWKYGVILLEWFGSERVCLCIIGRGL